MSNTRFVTFASVISEIEQSDLFMTVKARILETPKANLNGCRVTDKFVNSIISNKKRYVGLPLYADVKALKAGRYDRLGHLYDSKTGEFYSTQIGSFYEFEKENFEGGSYLVGYARIPKRNKDLSKAIAELFADGKLKFSFEIACGEYKDLEDGTFEIDAGENNFLEGTAIVTFPACEDAVALEFVAQREAGDNERGDEEMAEQEKVVAEEIVETPVENAEATPQTAEEEQTQAEESEGETASCNKEKEKAEEETAQVYVTETQSEQTDIDMYDTETGKNVHQSVEIRTSFSGPVDGTLVETDDGVHIAENEGDAPETPAETPAEEQTEESVEAAQEPETPVQAQEPEVPVQEVQESQQIEEIVQPGEDMKNIAETLNALAEAVKTLTEEVKTMKEERAEHMTASRNVVAETINPFVENITTNGTKYDLLQKDTASGSYSLLSK